MRISPLKDTLKEMGASFVERYGVEIVEKINDKEKEYHFIRDTVGLTDFSHVQKFRVPEETGLDFLDSLVAGNVARVRFGRVLHTFLSDENGELLADCYIANNDDEFIVLCESIADDARVRSLFTSDPASGIVDITESHGVIGVDGFKAWSVIKDIFGADTLGLPYMSIETYSFENTDVRLFRAGKTSEFGYLILVPTEIASKLFTTLSEAVKALDGGLCSITIHNDLRLEGRFFNIYSEGKNVGDPLSLGLQYMIDFDKEQFRGHDKIMARRKNGLKKKIIGIRAEKGTDISLNMPIFEGEREVGSVQALCYSYILDSVLGLALFDVDVAFAGLTFKLKSIDGPAINTISMPPIIPKSLSVKLDEI